MTVLPTKIFRPRRYRPGGLGTWSGHLPFAHDLVAALAPRLLVELGSHYGESYFGMCQAVDENGLPCSCYAIDTWQGDPHAGFYDESVFQEVSSYNDERYAAFSTLIRSTFDAAVGNFGEGTIDLLHIDGLHTYDAVRHDFDNWWPKVRPGGAVLFHDVAVRHLDFQVWRLWEELTPSLPHCEFHHSWGLGVLRKPGAIAPNPFLDAVFSSSRDTQDTLRHYYALQAELLERRHTAVHVPADSPQVLFQVFPHGEHGYVEATSIARSVTRGQWQDVVIDLPDGLTGPLRLDPVDRAAVVEFERIQLRHAVDGVVVQRWTPETGVAGLAPIAQLVALPADGSLRFLSLGADPQLLLPALEAEPAASPLVLDVRMRVLDDLTGLAPIVQSGLTASAYPLGLDVESKLALARQHELSAELRQLQAEREALIAEYRRAFAENDRLRDETSALRDRLAASETRGAALAHAEGRARQERTTLDRDLRHVSGELRAAYGSLSWQVTKPLRWGRRLTR